MSTIKPINYYILDFSYDYDTENDKSIAVISFTPRRDRFDHYHIEIKDKDVLKIKKWIDGFVDNMIKNAKVNDG